MSHGCSVKHSAKEFSDSLLSRFRLLALYHLRATVKMRIRCSRAKLRTVLSFAVACENVGSWGRKSRSESTLACLKWGLLLNLEGCASIIFTVRRNHQDIKKILFKYHTE